MNQRKTDRKKKIRDVRVKRKRNRLRVAEEYARSLEFKPPKYKKVKNPTKDKEIIDQLHHNLEILKALQEEHDKEQELKKNFNADLEAAGAKTAEEKMELIKENMKKNIEIHL